MLRLLDAKPSLPAGVGLPAVAGGAVVIPAVPPAVKSASAFT